MTHTKSSQLPQNYTRYLSPLINLEVPTSYHKQLKDNLKKHFLSDTEKLNTIYSLN